MKEFSKHQQEILNQIYDLILNPEVSESERGILKETKNLLEKGVSFETEMLYLRNAFLPWVITSHISKPTLDFYEMLRNDRPVGIGDSGSIVMGMRKRD